jgi:predicted O-linked N-acetylglucosamine transferase (SPINDLY family)
MLDWLKKILSGNPGSHGENAKNLTSHSDSRHEESLRQKESGDAMLDRADWEGAAAHYRQALALQPLYAEVHSNLALGLMQMQRFDTAREHSMQALAINPELFNSHYLLATISRQQGRDADAISHLRHAIAVKPDFAEAYHELALLLSHRGERALAQVAYRRVLALEPDHAAVLFNLAGLLEFEGKRQEAIANYRHALALKPDFNSARLAMLHQLMQTCDWNRLQHEIESVRQAVREMPVNIDTCDSPFSFLSLPGSTAAEQKRCAETWTLTQYRQQMQMRDALGFNFNRAQNSKPHIGYLSSDFCDHATARLMAEIFELHDRRQFRITAYSYSPADGSAMGARMHAAFDDFVDISAASDIEAAQRIYNDRVDILIDLKGYTGDSRSAILALRPAPVQVNYLGYPGTMGADFVDYLIADHFVIPEDQRGYYTEKIAYLPHCYQPNDRTRLRAANPGKAQVGLPETGIVFCCFNQTYKITPEMFSIWCELLNEVPGSVLWLIASNAHTQANLQREAVVRGVAPERLIFAPRVSADAHLARQQCADIFLDTIPYNAHTTCSDALWMGLPVVTLAGDTFPSRVAGSLLAALGVPELITYNREDYRALALQLALDDKKRAELRAKIEGLRDTAPLFDSVRFTRDLEQAYRNMLIS